MQKPDAHLESAFPIVSQETYGEHGEILGPVYTSGGMSLRDYFAAKAMQATWRADERTDYIATRAYELADAMLKARK